MSRTIVKRGSDGKALLRTMTPARATIIHEAKMIDFRRFRGVRTVTSFEQFYEKTKILGAGNFGHVYEARNLKADVVCAVKIMQKRKVCSDAAGREFIKKELACL